MDIIIAAITLIAMVTPFFAVPILHIIGFNRCFRNTLRFAERNLIATIQAVGICLILFAWLIVMVVTIVFSLHGTGNSIPFWVVGALYVASIVGVLEAAQKRLPIASLTYSIFRIPLDQTVPAAFDVKTKPALFASRHDLLLFDSAVDWWRKSGRDEQLITDADSSSEARGRIIGAFLDTAPHSFFIRRGPNIPPTIDRYLPVICSSRVILPTILFFIALLFHLLAIGSFHEFEGSDALRSVRLVMNFVFGALYSSEPGLRVLALLAAIVGFVSALLPYPGARLPFTVSVITYLALSLLSLPLAYDQWSNLLVIQLSSWGEWGIDKGLNFATADAWTPIKAVLTFSLTNVFGISLVVWPLYVLRLMQLAWSAEGHLFYENAVSRPAIFGGIRLEE